MKYLAVSGVAVILAFITFSFFYYEEVHEREEKYDYQLNKKINLINIVTPFNQSAKNYLPDGKQKTNALLFYLNCYCATCVNNLVAWERFSTGKEINKKVKVLLIINEKTHSYVKNIIKKKNIITSPVYLDTTNTLLTKDIFIGENNTILLSKDSRIKFIGSPLVHKSHRRKLIKIINRKL